MLKLYRTVCKKPNVGQNQNHQIESVSVNRIFSKIRTLLFVTTMTIQSVIIPWRGWRFVHYEFKMFAFTLSVTKTASLQIFF